MPDARLRRCREVYAEAWRATTTEGDVRVPFDRDEEESPHEPPRHDDVADQQPLEERG